MVIFNHLRKKMEASASLKKRPREETTDNPQISKEESSASDPESLTQDLAKQLFSRNNIVKQEDSKWFNEVFYSGMLPSEWKLSDEQIEIRLSLGINRCLSDPRSKKIEKSCAKTYHI